MEFGKPQSEISSSRREFLWNSGGGLGGIALAAMLGKDALAEPGGKLGGVLHHPPRSISLPALRRPARTPDFPERFSGVRRPARSAFSSRRPKDDKSSFPVQVQEPHLGGSRSSPQKVRLQRVSA